MKFPALMADLLRGGYTFLQTSECPDCREDVQMFRTPRGKVAPFVRTPRGRLVSHYAICAAARRRHAVATDVGQGVLFDRHGPG